MSDTGRDPLKYRVKFLILTILAIKPSHGYEISKKIEEISGGIIKGSPGSIYPILKELREEDLIEEEVRLEKGRLKKIYKLSKKGILYLLKELDVFYEIANSLIRLATQARQSLQKRINALEGESLSVCPDEELIRRLESLRNLIDRYIKVVKERYENCRK
jgi:PadR family transcriptional regulator PadR